MIFSPRLGTAMQTPPTKRERSKSVPQSAAEAHSVAIAAQAAQILQSEQGAHDYLHERQAAHYLHGLADKHGVELGNVTLDWRIIAVENVAPYDVTVYQFSVDTIDNALAEYDALGKLYRTCVENNNWPGRGRHDLLDLTWRA